MANIGDTYIITLRNSHLKWGTHRYTNSRGHVYGEGYIPIPTQVAYDLELLNSNGTNHSDIWGKNIFQCSSVDGLYDGILRAQGCKKAGDPYAKQFSSDKNLKALGSWYEQIGAKVGDKIKVTWISKKDIIIEKL